MQTKRQRVEHLATPGTASGPFTSQLVQVRHSSAPPPLRFGCSDASFRAEMAAADSAKKIAYMQKLRNQGPDSSTIAPNFCAVRSWAGTEIHPIHTAKRSIMSSGSWNCQKGGTADMRCQHDSPPLLMGPVSAPVSVGLQRPSSEQAAAEENAIPRGGLPQMGQTVYGVVESWNGASFVVTVQAEGCLLRGGRPAIYISSLQNCTIKCLPNYLRVTQQIVHQLESRIAIGIQTHLGFTRLKLQSIDCHRCILY